jgi:ABC-type nitrate/sulfonate/bicarbonate transport system substrate-binding protein
MIGRSGLAAAALAAVLAASAGAAHAQPVTFRLGYGGAAEEPMWLIMAKPDLAKNQGKAYTLEATKFTSSDKRAQAFEAGAIDLSVGSANGVIFAAAEGVTAKFIASISRESPRGFSTGYYVKESSPIRSVADLKGKTVGINGFSTSGHLWLKAALDKHGLSESDMRITPVPFAAMQEALDAGKIDLGQFPQPFAALAEKQMKVRKIFDAKYGVPFEEELTVVVGKDAFLKKNAAAVRALLEDLTASMRFYLDHPRQARQALIDARMVRVSPDVYMNMQDYYRDPTLRVDADALERMQAFQVKAGFQKKSADVRSLVDLSYLPQRRGGQTRRNAVTRVGPLDRTSQFAIAHQMRIGHVWYWQGRSAPTDVSVGAHGDDHERGAGARRQPAARLRHGGGGADLAARRQA